MSGRYSTSSWDSYWNSGMIDLSIMKVWARCFVKSYERYIGFRKSDVVLDFGSGHGDIPKIIESKVNRLYLLDKSVRMQKRLRHAFEENKHVIIASNLDQIPEPVDVIIMNSVSQYLTKREMEELLARINKVCKLNTRLVISDIIPMKYSKLTDFMGQLSRGVRKGFALRLLAYAASNTVYNPSLSLSSEQLTHYDEAEMEYLLETNGFKVKRMAENFTHSTIRFTLLGIYQGSPL